MISCVFGVLGWKVVPFAPGAKTTVITVRNWWNSHPVSPQNGIFLPKTRNSTILWDFNENHLKWVDFSEKYRSGRKKHLKRPKMDCVSYYFVYIPHFHPPSTKNHQTSPHFTKNGGILLNLVKIKEFHHSGSQSTRAASEPCKKAYELLLFFTSGAEGCFRVDFTWISHFSVKIMNFMKNHENS